MNKDLQLCIPGKKKSELNFTYTQEVNWILLIGKNRIKGKLNNHILEYQVGVELHWGFSSIFILLEATLKEQLFEGILCCGNILNFSSFRKEQHFCQCVDLISSLHLLYITTTKLVYAFLCIVSQEGLKEMYQFMFVTISSFVKNSI